MNRRELARAVVVGWRRTLILLLASLPTRDGLRKAERLYAESLRKAVDGIAVDLHKE